MNNRITAKNENQAPARPHWFSKRSQAGRVLLSGWFFFWIVGIVQPCCVALAGADDHATSQTMSMAEDAHRTGAAGGTSHPNDECPLAFTADAALPSQISLLPATTDYTPHLLVASQFVPFAAASEFTNSIVVYLASPLPRIYLRTQRLRI